MYKTSKYIIFWYEISTKYKITVEYCWVSKNSKCTGYFIKIQKYFNKNKFNEGKINFIVYHTRNHFFISSVLLNKLYEKYKFSKANYTCLHSFMAWMRFYINTLVLHYWLASNRFVFLWFWCWRLNNNFSKNLLSTSICYSC